MTVDGAADGGTGFTVVLPEALADPDMTDPASTEPEATEPNTGIAGENH